MPYKYEKLIKKTRWNILCNFDNKSLCLSSRWTLELSQSSCRSAAFLILTAEVQWLKQSNKSAMWDYDCKIDGGHRVGLLYSIGAYIVYSCHLIAHLVSEQWVTRLLQSAFRHRQAQSYNLNGDCGLSLDALSSKHGQFSPCYPCSAQFSWALSVTEWLLCSAVWFQKSFNLYQFWRGVSDRYWSCCVKEFGKIFHHFSFNIIENLISLFHKRVTHFVKSRVCMVQCTVLVTLELHIEWCCSCLQWRREGTLLHFPECKAGNARTGQRRHF